MAFVKYNTKDNANSTLLVGISAGATSLGIQAGNGTRFPSSNFIATIVQYTTLGDETSAVVKREKVLVSNNATDTFTITRGFGGDTPVAFNAGDSIYLNHVSAIDTDMQDEITRLESAKLNLGSLRTGLANAWRLFFSNGSNAETELALGASWTVLTSNGATSAPTFEVPTVDVVGLTEDTAGDMDADYLIKNNGTGLNKKIKVNKYKASDAEALVWTVQNKFIDPKQVKDNYGFTSISIATLTSPAGSFNSTQYSSSVNLTKWGLVNVTLGSISWSNANFNWIQTSPDNSTWTTVFSRSSWTTSADFITLQINANTYIRVFQWGVWSFATDCPCTARYQAH
jgi:hypothetical protein